VISRITGKLLTKDLERAEIMTAGGVAYDLAIPLSAYEELPKAGEEVSLYTHLVVREDDWLLFGFATVMERQLFRKLLTANGVGPALALGMLSNLTAERLARAIREKDIATLQGVPRVGRKKAERLILDLGDKLDEVMATGGDGTRPAGAGAEDAIRALVSLGYSQGEAEKAVRLALEGTARGAPATELIRAALATMGGR
jgi:holliday junction DNA helicase RuvA